MPALALRQPFCYSLADDERAIAQRLDVLNMTDCSLRGQHVMSPSLRSSNSPFALQLQMPQPQRVADDRHRAERHRRTGDHRAQQ